VIIFLTVTSVGIYQKDKHPVWNIISGISGFIIFFSGLAVIMSMKLGFPIWVLIKGFIWILLISLGGVFIKRFHHLRHYAFGVLIFLACSAVFFAVIKPF